MHVKMAVDIGQRVHVSEDGWSDVAATVASGNAVDLEIVAARRVS